MIQKSRCIFLEDKYKYTALIFAFQNEHFDIVKILIENGSEINHSNDFQQTAVMIASQKIHLNIVDLLMEKGAKLSMVDENGGTNAVLEIIKEKVLVASSVGNLEVEKHWLNSGFNPNYAKDKMGNDSPIIEAPAKGHLEIVKMFIENWAEINHINNDKETALMVACEKGH